MTYLIMTFSPTFDGCLNSNRLRMSAAVPVV